MSKFKQFHNNQNPVSLSVAQLILLYNDMEQNIEESKQQL